VFCRVVFAVQGEPFCGLATTQASPQPTPGQNWVFREARDKRVQWQAPKTALIGSGHVNLRLIWMMIGLHTVRLWQNETFHCRNHMNIITKTRKWERRRQIVTSTVFRGAYYLALEMIFCVNFSLVVAVLCS
jgi:hypothetical protein